MNKRFEFLEDLTSDVLFRAFGRTKEELFENSAYALSSVMCEINKIKPLKCIKINLKSDNLENLLFEWLSEIITQVDIYNMFFSRFNIKRISDTELEADICGENIDIEKGLVQVKAVTYYKFKLEKDDKEYKATVSCDV